MKEIGEFLKSSRIKNGVSLDEVSEDLNISRVELENLEEGNIRAFKDIYVLKELVKEYSKYLGLNPDEILDEFNDFMFEHTSKISLDDIKEARKLNKEVEEQPKIMSPYTYIRKKKFTLKSIKWKNILIGILLVLAVIIVISIVHICLRKEDKITTELIGRKCDYYEFSN